MLSLLVLLLLWRLFLVVANLYCFLMLFRHKKAADWRLFMMLANYDDSKIFYSAALAGGFACNHLRVMTVGCGMI